MPLKIGYTMSMNRPYRVFVILLLTTLMLFNYQNCGQQGQFTGLEAIPVSDSSGLQLDEFQGIRVADSQLIMNAFQDYVEVSGTCNTGGSIENRISFYLALGGNPVAATIINLDNLGLTDLHFRSGQCQNGRWNAFILRQNLDGSTLPSGTYDAYFTLELRKEGESFYTKGSTSSPVEIIIFPTN